MYHNGYNYIFTDLRMYSGISKSPINKSEHEKYLIRIHIIIEFEVSINK